MIVYNVKRRFFEMKNDADAYRRGEGLPPSALTKLQVDDRADLTMLLNGLCGGSGTVMEPPLTEAVQAVTEACEAVPDYVPRFLAESWAKLWKKEKAND